MFDVLRKYNCKVIEPLHEGLSSDKKFYIETAEGQQLFLRVNDISEYERMKIIYELMEKAELLDIPMTAPVEFGICEEGRGCFQLLTWCNGKSAEVVLPKLSKQKQYNLGVQSGEILSKIHSIPAPPNLCEWSGRYDRMMKSRLRRFTECNVIIKNSDEIFRYYEDNKHLLTNRPQCFHHGDYHNENLLVDNMEISVIDWQLLDFENFADPWEEFNRINHTKLLPSFTSGQINGYFQGKPPVEFWKLFALYVSIGALMLVSWAYFFQKDELEYTVKNANDVLKWFDNMKKSIPTWYKEGHDIVNS